MKRKVLSTGQPRNKQNQIYNIVPTLKQKKAAKIILENIGNPKPMGIVMIEAGYSPSMAKNPQYLTESRGYKMVLMEYGLTDTALAQTLADGLNANRVDVIKGISRPSQIPDHQTRLKSLVIALKIRGLYNLD